MPVMYDRGTYTRVATDTLLKGRVGTRYLVAVGLHTILRSNGSGFHVLWIPLIVLKVWVTGEENER